MERRDLYLFLVVGLVLFVLWRRSEADLAAAQARAEGIAAGSSLINSGVAVVRSIYGI